MTTIEIILSFVTTVCAGGNIAQFVMLKSAKRKAQAEAQAEYDAVLLKRIEFLDERVTRLESLACYRKDCKDRV